jgi:hypothetical protein
VSDVEREPPDGTDATELQETYRPKVTGKLPRAARDALVRPPWYVSGE